jgi:ubiquinone/menaquinone biosynthesis C-methylase UbiE
VAAPPLTPLAVAVLHLDPAPERVLQIECGDGDGALFLAREFPSARIRGVDHSPERVRAATARVGLDPEGRVAFKLGAPSALPFPDGFFDLVVQLDGRSVVSEIARVLRPGGHVVLARSHGSAPTGGFTAWVLRRHLRRRGIELVETAAAGDGSFSVGRLRLADRQPDAD